MRGTGAAGMFRGDTGLAVFLYNMFSDLVKAILRTHGTSQSSIENTAHQSERTN